MILLCKLAAAVFVAAVLTLLLKKDQPAFAFLVSACTAAGLLAVVVQQVDPWLDWLRTLDVYFQGQSPAVLLRVLGAIQPAAAVCAGAEGEVTAAPAAVAQAFIRWLTGLAARQPLAVHIRRAGEMDDVSRGVLEYLLAERPAGLTLLTEDGGALGDMSSGK